MAFSFGGASSSGCLFGSSTPAFGAGSSAFSFSSSASAFGSSQTGSNPFGGGFGQSTPAFGASTPAFGASASSAPAFGGGLFQASTPAFGGGGLFGSSQPASSPGLGLALAPFQQQQQPQQQQQTPQYQTLITRENKPIVRSTAWDEIQPQGQGYLLEIEKLVLQTREDLRQLEQCDRLQNSQGLKQDMKDDEKAVKQVLQTLSNELKVHDEAVTAFREKILQLRRYTEVGVRAFVRSKNWREAARASQSQVLPPHVREQLNGAVVLPSLFLRELVPALQETLRQYGAMAGGLEKGLALGGPGGQGGRRAGGWDPMTALPASVANVHDFIMHLAARLERLQERLSGAKEAFLADGAANGDDRDPFFEAEEQEVLREREAKRRNVAMMRQAAAPQAAPASGAPLALGVPQPASTAAPAGQSLFGGFGAAATSTLAPAGSAFNFASSAGGGGGSFGAAPASSPGLFGGAGAFGAANTLTQQPSVRKGKSRK